MGQREINRRKRQQLEEGQRRSADRAETTRQRREQAAADRAAADDAILREPLTAQEKALRDRLVDRELEILEQQRVEQFAELGPNPTNAATIRYYTSRGRQVPLQTIQDAVEARIRFARLPEQPQPQVRARLAEETLTTRQATFEEIDAQADARARRFDQRDAGWQRRPATEVDEDTGRRVVAGPIAARLRAIAADYSPHQRAEAYGRRNPGRSGKARPGQAHMDEFGDIIPATPSREKPRPGRDMLDSDQLDTETTGLPTTDMHGTSGRGISAETRQLPSEFDGGDPTDAAIDTAVNGPRQQDIERR
jgi:hypothetical protein